MGRCLSLSENPVVVTARTTALDKKYFKSPQSMNFDASPYDIENPPEINQVVDERQNPTEPTFLTKMNHEISAALASLDKLKQYDSEWQRCQEAWSSVLRCSRKEKRMPCSKYPNTLVALKEYRETAGNLFDKIDAKDLQEVIYNKETIASTLDNKISKIEEKLNFYKRRKYLKDICIIIIAAMILGIAIALQGRPLRWFAIAGFTFTVIKEIRDYIRSFWDDQKLNLESKKKVIKKVSRRYSAVMDESVTIQLLVDVIKSHIGSVREKVNEMTKVNDMKFVLKEGEEAVELGVVEIELKMNDMMKEMNNLQENVKLCIRQAKKANREFSIFISNEKM